MKHRYLLCLLMLQTVHAEPWKPADDAAIVEVLPTGAPSGLVVAVAATTLEEAIQTVRTRLQRGQTRSDPREYGYAEAILEPWQKRAPDDPRIAVLMARILQFRHDFDAARLSLRRALSRDPRNVEAWLLLASIEQVQGRYPEARAACAQVVGLADLLIPMTCGSAIAALTGNAAASADVLQRQLAASSDSAGATRSWAWTVLAEIRARLGQDDAAAEAFRMALSIDAEDVYARSAFADLELQRGRPQAALDVIAGRTTADALLLRAAIAARQATAPNAAALAADFAERVDEMRRRGDLSHRRELARAALQLDQQPAEALRLALGNWSIQREPADAALVLEAAQASGRPADADAVRAFIREHRWEDVYLTRLMATSP